MSHLPYHQPLQWELFRNESIEKRNRRAACQRSRRHAVRACTDGLSWPEQRWVTQTAPAETVNPDTFDTFKYRYQVYARPPATPCEPTCLTDVTDQPPPVRYNVRRTAVDKPTAPQNSGCLGHYMARPWRIQNYRPSCQEDAPARDCDVVDYSRNNNLKTSKCGSGPPSNSSSLVTHAPCTGPAASVAAGDLHVDDSRSKNNNSCNSHDINNRNDNNNNNNNNNNNGNHRSRNGIGNNNNSAKSSNNSIVLNTNYNRRDCRSCSSSDNNNNNNNNNGNKNNSKTNNSTHNHNNNNNTNNNRTNACDCTSGQKELMESTKGTHTLQARRTRYTGSSCWNDMMEGFALSGLREQARRAAAARTVAELKDPRSVLFLKSFLPTSREREAERRRREGCAYRPPPPRSHQPGYGTCEMIGGRQYRENPEPRHTSALRPDLEEYREFTRRCPNVKLGRYDRTDSLNEALIPADQSACSMKQLTTPFTYTRNPRRGRQLPALTAPPAPRDQPLQWSLPTFL